MPFISNPQQDPQEIPTKILWWQWNFQWPINKRTLSHPPSPTYPPHVVVPHTHTTHMMSFCMTHACRHAQLCITSFSEVTDSKRGRRARWWPRRWGKAKSSGYVRGRCQEEKAVGYRVSLCVWYTEKLQLEEFFQLFVLHCIVKFVIVLHKHTGSKQNLD